MITLNKKELLKIEGGLSLSGSIINSFVRGINSLLDLGRSLGTAIRRITSNSVCKL